MLIALGIASTTVHHGHNSVVAEVYPPVPHPFPTALSYRIGIAVSVPVATALVLWGTASTSAAGTTGPGGP